MLAGDPPGDPPGGLHGLALLGHLSNEEAELMRI